MGDAREIDQYLHRFEVDSFHTELRNVKLFDCFSCLSRSCKLFHFISFVVYFGQTLACIDLLNQDLCIEDLQSSVLESHGHKCISWVVLLFVHHRCSSFYGAPLCKTSIAPFYAAKTWIPCSGIFRISS